MAAHEIYQYSDLTGEDAIRLIHLQPCDSLDTGLECFLKDATLAECRDDIGDHFIALSYVWGDQNDTRSISVDGRRLEITVSLDSALRHIRDHRRVLRIWADGVCINQKDTHDRNRQVRLMRDIYSAAQHTIIFLGLSSPRCDSVMQLMASATRAYVESKEGSDITFENLLAGHEATVEQDILSKPWFNRVWILQELVLSQNPWVQCGKFRTRWNLFCKSVVSSKSSLWKPDSRTVLENMSDTRTEFIKTSLSAPKEPRKPPGETLFGLMRQRKGCGVTDRRDLIYGHLGLVDAETRNMIPINYDKSVAQVYEDVTRLYAQWIGALYMLQLVGQNQPEQRPRSLPSWVNDWSSQIEPGKIFNVHDYSSYYSAQRDRSASFIVPHIMALPGYYIGNIKAIIPMSALPNTWCTSSTITPSYDDFRLKILSENATILSLLDWVLREDNDALHARRLLVGFVSTMPLPIATTNEGILTDWPTLEGLQKENLTRIISIMSEWPEVTSAMPTVIKRPFAWLLTTPKKELFLRRCIHMLIMIRIHFNETDSIATLDRTNIFVQVPNSVHTGDYVADLKSGYGALKILRPHDSPLSEEEESIIREDFILKDTDGYHRPTASTPFSNCRFIASGSNSFAEACRGCHADDWAWESVYKHKENLRIFALH